MRRFLVGGMLLAALLGPAQAEDTPRPAVPSAVPTADAPTADAPTLKPMPQRLGYAFEQPEILIRQRLFGLAHGLSLLAASCLDLPEHSTPVQDAYTIWHVKQAQTIEIVALDLAAYYFGPRAAQAQWQDLARALNLKDSIQPSLGTVSLQDACTSLPEAITQPRYELDRLLAEGAAPELNPAKAPAVASPARRIDGPQDEVATPQSGIHGMQSQATQSEAMQSEALQSAPPAILQGPAE